MRLENVTFHNTRGRRGRCAAAAQCRSSCLCDASHARLVEDDLLDTGIVCALMSV